MLTHESSATAALERFRAGFYRRLTRWADATFEITDAVLCAELLLQLSSASTQPVQPVVDKSDQVETLRGDCTTDLQRRFVDLLCERELALPDKVHPEPIGVGAQPDFALHLPGGPVAVFLDSEASAGKPGRDLTAEDQLFDAGWMVVRFGDEELWREQLGQHSEIFGKGR